MAPILIFAFMAGILTILSPCILPVVPLVAGTASSGGGRRLAGIVTGFAGTFVALTVVLASTLAAAGLTTDRLRLASAVLLGIFGAAIAVPWIGRWFEAHSGLSSQVASRLLDRGPGSSFGGGVVLGAAIGAVWAPCVGPIMAAVIAAAVASGPSTEAALVALVYAAGAAIPLALVGRAGRRAVRAFGGPERRARAVRVFGAMTVAAALLVVTGLDVPIQGAVANALPAEWASALVEVEQQPAVQEELEMLRTEPSTSPGAVDARPLPTPVAASLPGRVALEDLGPAPEMTGIAAWINSDPLTMASLRGKVVLVHFWTFGCINCVHVQPYVKAWYDRYADAGFVVVGVHTPELSFERDLDNVRDAVAKAEVRFPVAFDPSFATWNAYRNSYWPAFYFVDRSGRIRSVHFGEGDYDGSEQVIRELLAEPG